MSHPCHHDCSDFTDDETDLGCCSPLPVRITCDAPVLPVPECDEEDAVMTYDPDTEQFTVSSILYDQNCSAILDQNNDAILTLID